MQSIAIQSKNTSSNLGQIDFYQIIDLHCSISNETIFLLVFYAFNEYGSQFTWSIIRQIPNEHLDQSKIDRLD